jgi:hypothetical protein
VSKISRRHDCKRTHPHLSKKIRDHDSVDSLCGNTYLKFEIPFNSTNNQKRPKGLRRSWKQFIMQTNFVSVLQQNRKIFVLRRMRRTTINLGTIKSAEMRARAVSVKRRATTFKAGTSYSRMSSVTVPTITAYLSSYT